MKVHYNQDEDVLMIELNNKKIDDAYEVENMIVHVSESREPVLLEIFKGSQLLKDTIIKLPKKVIQSILPSSFPSFAQKTK